VSNKIIRYVEDQITKPVPIIRGVPDHRLIRKIEKEIHGEPITPYPGTHWHDEWDRDYHWKHHARYAHGDHAKQGCMWCEDARRDRLVIKAEAEAKYAPEKRRIPVPVKIALVGFGTWVMIMGFILFLVWGLT